MGEYIGRINVSKDTMLFIVNTVFKKGIKESTTKEENKETNDILKEIREEFYNT